MITIKDFEAQLIFARSDRTGRSFTPEYQVLVESLLKERDEALQSLRDANAKAEAYREVAWKYCSLATNKGFATPLEQTRVDVEVAKLLSQRKGERA